MDPLTLAAASALVVATATDGYQQARDGLVAPSQRVCVRTSLRSDVRHHLVVDVLQPLLSGSEKRRRGSLLQRVDIAAGDAIAHAARSTVGDTMTNNQFRSIAAPFQTGAGGTRINHLGPTG